MVESYNKPPYVPHIIQSGREEIWPSSRNEQNQIGRSGSEINRNNENVKCKNGESRNYCKVKVVCVVTCTANKKYRSKSLHDKKDYGERLF